MKAENLKTILNNIPGDIEIKLSIDEECNEIKSIIDIKCTVVQSKDKPVECLILIPNDFD